METIILNESQLENVIKKISEELTNEMLPIQQVQGNIQINYNTFQQILQDLSKANLYFNEIKPKNNPQYSDRLNKLNRSIKSLEKLTK